MSAYRQRRVPPSRPGRQLVRCVSDLRSSLKPEDGARAAATLSTAHENTGLRRSAVSGLSNAVALQGRTQSQARHRYKQFETGSGRGRSAQRTAEDHLYATIADQWSDSIVSVPAALQRPSNA
jgi:hypothetical protein